MTRRENTQLNRDIMYLRELHDKHEDVAAFTDTVPYLLKDRNERFPNDLNTLVATYTTDLTTTTDIRPTVAAVRRAQEVTRTHAERLTNTRP